jgi:hypothetical protein
LSEAALSIWPKPPADSDRLPIRGIRPVSSIARDAWNAALVSQLTLLRQSADTNFQRIKGAHFEGDPSCSMEFARDEYLPIPEVTRICRQFPDERPGKAEQCHAPCVAQISGRSSD